MLTAAVASGVAGWGLYASSISSAVRLREQSPALAIVAYGLLIVSSVTLVLGFWYLLLAQVERLARMIDADPQAREIGATCGNCGWQVDPPDRFCRHCGHALGAGDAGGTPPLPRKDL
jgi:hypothetical protein